MGELTGYVIVHWICCPSLLWEYMSPLRTALAKGIQVEAMFLGKSIKAKCDHIYTWNLKTQTSKMN